MKRVFPLLLAGAMFMTLSVMRASAQEYVSGNPKCADYGYSELGGVDWSTPDNKNISWNNATGQTIILIIVKAGNGANLYYPGGATSGNVVTPNNNGDNQADLGHITFCTGESTPEPTPVTPEPTATSTTVPSPTPTIEVGGSTMTPVPTATIPAEPTATSTYQPSPTPTIEVGGSTITPMPSPTATLEPTAPSTAVIPQPTVVGSTMTPVVTATATVPKPTVGRSTTKPAPKVVNGLPSTGDGMDSGTILLTLAAAAAVVSATIASDIRRRQHE